MIKKLFFSLFAIILISLAAVVSAYNSDDLNKRLRNCTPTKDFSAGGSTLYQISGLYEGNVCKYKIQYGGVDNKPDVICSVPMEKMYEMTSYDPLVVQKTKDKYCKISIKSLSTQNIQKKVY